MKKLVATWKNTQTALGFRTLWEKFWDRQQRSSQRKSRRNRAGRPQAYGSLEPRQLLASAGLESDLSSNANLNDVSIQQVDTQNQNSFNATATSSVIQSWQRDGHAIESIGDLARPDQLSSISVTFNQQVNVSANALSVRNDSEGGSLVSLDGVTFEFNDQTQEATWDFSSVADLPAGYYTLSLDDAQIEAVDGSALSTDSSFDQQIYAAIRGDVNLDGRVDLLNDAFGLVGNLGVESDASWQNGDFNGDGSVDLLTDAFQLIGNLGVEVTGQSVSSHETEGVFEQAPREAANSSSGVTESNGVATIDVVDGNEINQAFVTLTDYLANNATAVSGVVNVSANTTFSEQIVAADDIVLNVPAGVTLSLDQPPSATTSGAIRFNQVSNSGLTGSGTLDFNGHTLTAIAAVGVDQFRIGNTDTSASNPDRLKIIGWRDGVLIGSFATVAATKITVENLEITNPHSVNVNSPLFISNRPSANGLWVEEVTIDNLLVDGGQPDGAGGTVGGEHSFNNGFTADQIVLQGVRNATVTNVTSLNGGENGLTVSWGSRYVTVSDVTIDNPDAHAFNIGSSGYAIDVVDATGFEEGQLLRGVTSGSTAAVFAVFPNEGRIWVVETAENGFAAGETLEVTDPGVMLATQITETFRTSNVTVENSVTTNAGRNVSLNLNPAGEPVAFSDVFLQQAENIFIQNNEFRTLGRELSPGVYADHFGINGTVSSFTFSNNTFVDYINQRPVVLNANSSQAAGVPELSTIDGTSNDDVFTGTQFADVIDGEAGNDDLGGLGGNDTIIGRDGDDTLRGGGGDDTVLGDDGNDTLLGDGGQDTIRGGLGNDTINGGNDDDEIFGDDGDDILRGDGGNDVLFGGVGGDTINGGNGDDELRGEDGDDALIGDGGNDTIIGGLGVDTINGGTGDDEIHGDAGNDILRGEGDNDTIYGGDGDDRFFGGEGSDLLIGGAGFDIINGENDDDVIHGDAGNDQLRGDGGNDTIFGGLGVDVVTGGIGDDEIHGDEGGDILRGEDGNDTIFGGANNDTIEGGEGDDILAGDDGNDTFIAGAGGDAHDGGDGIDVVDYRPAQTAISVDLQDASFNAGDLAAGDSHVSIENLFGSDFNDDLRGSLDNNSINAGDGNDSLRGNAGDDILTAGNGDDLLIGGAGADVHNGGLGLDRASYGSSTAGILLDLDNLALNIGDAAGDTFVSIERYFATGLDDSLSGRAGVDYLAGEAGNDFLAGRAGPDTLLGGAGDDVLQGGQGADVLDGGTGIDTVSYADATSAVVVYLDGSVANGGIAGGDTFIEVENIEGSNFNDQLFGDQNANQFAGGGGNDRFIFQTGWGSDTITDFANNGIEKIDFRGNFGLTAVEDLAITDVAGGVTLAFLGDQILLEGLSSGDIDSTDFLFDSLVNHVFTINTTTDKPDVNLADGLALDEDGNTSLRAAIMQANAAGVAATSTLLFDIQDGVGSTFVIQPSSALPFIVNQLTIDGSTQVGASVVIDGSQIAGGLVDGLLVTADGVEVQSIGLTGFSSDGIEVRNADDVVVNDVQAFGNSGTGIRFSGATNSEISNSVITGNNTSGVQVVGSGDQGNEISNNLIGIGTDEVADGNRFFGVQVTTAGNTIINNTVSGNRRSGIVLSGPQAENNVVQRNRVGTDSTGTVAVGNNAFGILISNSDNNLIGGPLRVDQNIVSGNGGAGISLGSNSSGNRLERNFVGLDESGRFALANGTAGIFLRAGANDTTVINNFVASNRSGQVTITGITTTNNVLTQNRIGFGFGLNGTGFAAFQGGVNAIQVLSPNNTIGGPDPSDGNTITGSTNGVGLSGAFATNNLVQNNTIGSINAGAADFGVVNGVQILQGASDNDIVENLIAHSSGDAIRSPGGGTGNTFSQNRLRFNEFGIDLTGTGNLANDAGDADLGPNQLQNTPVVQDGVSIVLTSTAPDLANITITYQVDTDPANANYNLTTEFFLSDLSGQDAFYVGSDVYTETDFATGLKTITFTGVDINGILRVNLVATATDEFGNTSQLSLPASTVVT